MANYRYNNSVLPELPVWDTKTYPYAMIFYEPNSEAYFLFCVSSPLGVRTVDGEEAIGYDADARCYRFGCTAGALSWGSGSEYNSSSADGSEWVYFTPGGITWIWCNEDITDEIGNVVYEATDPVLVREYSVSEVTLAPQDISIEPGVATEIPHTLTLSDGTELDNKEFEWNVLVFDSELNIVEVEWASINENGLLTITADSEKGYKVAAQVMLSDGSLANYVTIEKKAFDLKSWLIGFVPGLAGGRSKGGSDEPNTPVEQIVSVIHPKSVILGWMIGRQIARQRGALDEGNSYNLADFGGYYYSVNTDNDFEITEFAAGRFPLSQSIRYECGAESDVVAPATTCYLNKLPFQAGEYVEIDFTFPKPDFGVLQYDHRRIEFAMDNGTFLLPQKASVYFNRNNNGLVLLETNKIFETPVLRAKVGANGVIDGFTLEGLLVDKLSKITISDRAVTMVNEKPITFTMTTSFDTHDDLRIVLRG